MRTKRDGESGQSLVELALVLPFLLLVLLGIIDFGRILLVHQMVSEAARDATRYASVGNSDDQVGQTVQDDTRFVGSGATWSISPAGSRSSGDSVTVSVSESVAILDPIMMVFVGSQYEVTSSFTMRVE